MAFGCLREHFNDALEYIVDNVRACLFVSNLKRRPLEFIVSTDNSRLWKRHLLWSHLDGKSLRDILIQRFGSNMTFMSLLLAANVTILFSPSDVTTTMRNNFSRVEGYDDKVQQAIGYFLVLTIILALLAIIASFAAWAAVSPISDANVHVIMRSSIGLYASSLPGRLISFTILTHFVGMLLWLFVLLPRGTGGAIICAFSAIFYVHVVSTFSALERLIMHTSAMGMEQIYGTAEAETKTPEELERSLANKAREHRKKRVSVRQQYTTKHGSIGDSCISATNEDQDVAQDASFSRGL